MFSTKRFTYISRNRTFLCFLYNKFFFYFRKQNFLALRLKKLLYYLTKKSFLYFQKFNFLALKTKKFRRAFFQLETLKKPSLKKVLVFKEMEIFSHKLKNFLYFRRQLANPKKFSLWRNLSYFSKKTSPGMTADQTVK